MTFENERKRQSRRTKMNAKSWNEKREGKVKKNQSDFLLKHFWQDICLGIIMMPLCAIYTYVISFIWCCFFYSLFLLPGFTIKKKLRNWKLFRERFKITFAPNNFFLSFSLPLRHVAITVGNKKRLYTFSIIFRSFFCHTEAPTLSDFSPFLN